MERKIKNYCVKCGRKLDLNEVFLRDSVPCCPIHKISLSWQVLYMDNIKITKGMYGQILEPLEEEVKEDMKNRKVEVKGEKQKTEVTQKMERWANWFSKNFSSTTVSMDEFKEKLLQRKGKKYEIMKTNDKPFKALVNWLVKHNYIELREKGITIKGETQ